MSFQASEHVSRGFVVADDGFVPLSCLENKPSQRNPVREGEGLPRHDQGLPGPQERGAGDLGPAAGDQMTLLAAQLTAPVRGLH